MSYYQGRDFVPMPQEGDGLGDLFASAKPMLMGFARKAGKNLLSAGTSVLRDVLSGKDAKASARQALRSAQLKMLGNTNWKNPYYWSTFTIQSK
ncbi:MAG: CHAT domain-containing protein [Cyanobacteria bacterium P01_D01_bin.116]